MVAVLGVLLLVVLVVGDLWLPVLPVVVLLSCPLVVLALVVAGGCRESERLKGISCPLSDH